MEHNPNISQPVMVVKNTGILVIAQFVTMGSGVVWVAAFARYVGPSIYGLYNYALSVMALLALLINFGIEPLLTRNIARQPENAEGYVKNALFIKIILALFVLTPFFLYGVLSWDHTLVSILIICGVGTIVDAVVGLLNSALYAFENMIYDAIGQSVRGILLIAICLPLIHYKVSFIHVLWISVGLSFLKALICWYGLRKKTRGIVNQSEKLSIGMSFSIFKDSFAFAVLSIIVVVYNNLIILLIRFILKDDTALGYFAAAQRIYLFALIIPAMFHQAIYPVLSRTFVQSFDNFTEIFEKVYRYLLAIAFPVGVGMAILAPFLINLIYGERFGSSVISLRILSLGLLNGPGFVMGAALSAINKQSLNAMIFGLTVILLGLFSYLAIPILGIEGACWATVVSNLTGLLVYSIILFRHLRIPYPWEWLFKICASSAIMGVLMLATSQYIPGKVVPFLASTMIGIMAYLLCLILLRSFSGKDAELISSLIPCPAIYRYHIQKTLFRI